MSESEPIKVYVENQSTREDTPYDIMESSEYMEIQLTEEDKNDS